LKEIGLCRGRTSFLRGWAKEKGEAHPRRRRKNPPGKSIKKTLLKKKALLNEEKIA